MWKKSQDNSFSLRDITIAVVYYLNLIAAIRLALLPYIHEETGRWKWRWVLDGIHLKWHSQNPPHALAPNLCLLLSNMVTTEFISQSRIFPQNCNLYIFKDFKGKHSKLFLSPVSTCHNSLCQESIHFTSPKYLVTQIKPIYSFHVIKVTLFIEAVTELEGHNVLYAETKKKLRMKKNHLHSFKLLS